MPRLENVERIEPAFLTIPSAEIADVVADLSATAATLGAALHPRTAVSLADAVRVMNTYYSNLIEGHNTRPRDIMRALAGDFDDDRQRRNLQLEATSHIRLQTGIDRRWADRSLPEPASRVWIRALHREFYRDASPEMLRIEGGGRAIAMTPGEWRSRLEHDVEVGMHAPPSSGRVADFMRHFEERFRMERMGSAARLLAMAGAHHRFNYIHPFPDGNGRISRLMSHAMAHWAGIGAHGLWSISRGLARGLEARNEYKLMMRHADSPRQGDRDGRGSLSESALEQFTLWFLRTCLDQVDFMKGLFDLEALGSRLDRYVDRHDRLKPQTAGLLREALIRGEFERGEAARITGLPERSARRVLRDAIDDGMLGSHSEKGRVSLRFPAKSLDTLFPRLYHDD